MAHAERIAALNMIHSHSRGSSRRLTLGADKGYDSADFVRDLRRACATPHVALKDSPFRHPWRLSSATWAELGRKHGDPLDCRAGLRNRRHRRRWSPSTQEIGTHEAHPVPLRDNN